MNEPMRDEFFDLVTDHTTQRFLEQKHGQEARDENELPALSTAELRYAVHGLIRAYNEAINDGAMATASVYYSVLQQLLDVNEDVAEYFENQRPRSLFEAISSGGNSGI